MSEKHYVIGIDGGGTKTIALLADHEGTVLAEAKTGASNPQVVGFDKSAQILSGLVRECCTNIQAPESSITTIIAGIAGTGRSVDKEKLLHELKTQDLPCENIIIETDARIALDGALPWRPGIVLIAGTGSIAYYRTEKNEFFRAGGWGRILGDEGSGYSIAREALKEVMLQHEGRGIVTNLTQKALDFFHVASVDQLVSAISQEGIELASFAPEVLHAAEENDPIAVNILEANAGELLILVETLLKKNISNDKLTLAMIGGLLDHENTYRIHLRRIIRQTFPNVYIQKPKFPPVYGALLLALNPFSK